VCSTLFVSVRSWDILRQMPRPLDANKRGRTTSLLGSNVTLLVATTVEEINRHLHTFLSGGPTCIGLDAEWRPDEHRRRPAGDSLSEESSFVSQEQGCRSSVAVTKKANNVAVLQLASEDVVLVIQLLRATEYGKLKVPETLSALLAAPHIAKLGVGIHDDRSPTAPLRACVDVFLNNHQLAASPPPSQQQAAPQQLWPYLQRLRRSARRCLRVRARAAACAPRARPHELENSCFRDGPQELG
jgi:hypothetical protein